jgi:O-antigen/teichoic acid export membrane protein
LEGDQTRKKLLVFTLSTIATIAISSFVKITIPRKIGPAEFGTFCTFENISISIFALTTFGLEHITRSRKLVSDDDVHRIHNEAASFRILICLLIIFGSFYYPIENKKTLSLLLAWQLFFTQNSLYSSILQRYEKITANAATSILSKILFFVCFISVQSDINSSYEFALLTTSFEVFRTLLIFVTIRRLRLPISFVPAIPQKKNVSHPISVFFSACNSTTLRQNKRGNITPYFKYN